MVDSSVLSSEELLQEAIDLYGIIKMSRVFPLSCSDELLLQVFEEASGDLGYTVYEKTATSITAMKDFSKGGPALLKCVSPALNRSRSLMGNTAICRCGIENGSTGKEESERDDCFKMFVYTASDCSWNRQLGELLEEKLGDFGHYWMSVMHGAVLASVDGEDSEEDVYRIFEGILDNTNYSVGLEAAAFCEEFREKYAVREDPSWSLPHPARITKEVLQTSQKMSASIRQNIQSQGLSLAQDVMFREYLPSTERCVRRYLFGRVGGIVWEVYSRYYSREDAAFVSRCEQLKERCGVDELVGICGVREDFIARDGRRLYVDGSRRLFEVEETMCAESGLYPHAMEKLLSVTSLLRRDALAANGKELVDMDDVIPVYVLALLTSGMSKPFAIWHLLLDSLSEEERLEGKGKAVALLEGSSTTIAFGKWDEDDDNSFVAR